MDRTGIFLHYPNMDAIPTYALYGGQEAPGDWLHWETIQARSRLHDFRIAPHRHEHFFQILTLTQGSARLELDDIETLLVPPAVVILPALSVHGFTFSPDVDGLVVTLMERDIEELGLGVPMAAVLEDAPAAHTALAELIAEADRPDAWSDLALRARLQLLMVALLRAPEPDQLRDAASQRTRQHAQAFQHLVEQRYRQTRRVADYAAAIGISPTHLGRVSRDILGATPLQLIERRTALEARRMLRFSMLSINQIGAELGYDDPAYFSRFIKRMLGQSPRQFRLERQV